MASGGVVSPGMTIANSPFLIWELGALNNRNAIIGYRMLIDWAAIEPTEGNYDFSQITAVENYLKTQLNVPKHLVLVVLPGYFGNKTCNGDVVPNYILNNSAYGKSPNTGSYGWWGGTGNGNTCSAAIWRSNVMDRWIALHQALGKAFDSDPFFETIMFQEGSWIVGTVADNHGDYPGDSIMMSLFTKLLQATVAAFPHTNVVFENTWLATLTPSQQFEQTMILNRVAPGTADTYGQTFVDAHGGHLNGPGLDAYIGNTAPGSTYSGPDYRSRIPSMVDIEGPDLGPYGNNQGYSPADICAALNKSYKSSHAFWTYLGNDSSVPMPSRWSNLVTTVTGCPLTNIGYPAAYPQ